MDILSPINWIKSTRSSSKSALRHRSCCWNSWPASWNLQFWLRYQSSQHQEATRNSIIHQEALHSYTLLQSSTFLKQWKKLPSQIVGRPTYPDLVKKHVTSMIHTSPFHNIQIRHICRYDIPDIGMFKAGHLPLTSNLLPKDFEFNSAFSCVKGSRFHVGLGLPQLARPVSLLQN